MIWLVHFPNTGVFLALKDFSWSNYLLYQVHFSWIGSKYLIMTLNPKHAWCLCLDGVQRCLTFLLFHSASLEVQSPNSDQIKRTIFQWDYVSVPFLQRLQSCCLCLKMTVHSSAKGKWKHELVVPPDANSTIIWSDQSYCPKHCNIFLLHLVR